MLKSCLMLFVLCGYKKKKLKTKMRVTQTKDSHYNYGLNLMVNIKRQPVNQWVWSYVGVFSSSHSSQNNVSLWDTILIWWQIHTKDEEKNWSHKDEGTFLKQNDLFIIIGYWKQLFQKGVHSDSCGAIGACCHVCWHCSDMKWGIFVIAQDVWKNSNGPWLYQCWLQPWLLHFYCVLFEQRF